MTPCFGWILTDSQERSHRIGSIEELKKNEESTDTISEPEEKREFRYTVPAIYERSTTGGPSGRNDLAV